jgi:hypothetical protein
VLAVCRIGNGSVRQRGTVRNESAATRCPGDDAESVSRLRTTHLPPAHTNRTTVSLRAGGSNDTPQSSRASTITSAVLMGELLSSYRPFCCFRHPKSTVIFIVTSRHIFCISFILDALIFRFALENVTLCIKDYIIDSKITMQLLLLEKCQICVLAGLHVWAVSEEKPGNQVGWIFFILFPL